MINQVNKGRIFLYFLTCLLISVTFSPLLGAEKLNFQEEYIKSWHQHSTHSPSPIIEDLTKITYASGILFINEFHHDLYILLGCRSKTKEWNIPGGFFEEDKDSDLQDGAIRETNEELNYTKSDQKIDKSILKNANSSSIISPHPTALGKFLQFTMFLASYPFDKLQYINRAIFSEREKKHEIKEFQWFLLRDVLDQMYSQKLEVTPEAILINKDKSTINVSCLRGKKRISLYPELILMLSSLWPDSKKLEDWAPLLQLVVQNKHLCFIRNDLEKFVIDHTSRQTSSSGSLSSTQTNHKYKIKSLKVNSGTPTTISLSGSPSKKVFPYSQTEGFWKIILGTKYVENEIATNMKTFFKEFHDPVYRKMFNCPDFSFDDFDDGFKQEILRIIEAEKQSQEFVFYHGLNAEMLFFYDFITELYSQLCPKLTFLFLTKVVKKGSDFLLF